MTLVRTLLITLMLTGSFGAADRPAEIPLWPGGAPGSEGKPMKEVVTTSASGELSVSGIHNPSITPYLPARDKATGLAILVIPGGGHRVLAITHEGYNVAEWLRDRGIAAFVLKHRLAREADSTYKIDVESYADTKRALQLIRSRAAEWGIDPGRVGALGFSAGGELVSMASARFEAGDAAATDPLERQNSKPTFQALIYPGRSGDIQPAKDSPPAFLAAAYNDRQDISEGLAEAYLRFKRAGVPAELHIYGTGGHGFGQRATNTRPVGQWMARFEEWLAESGFLRRR
jgi:acetyl esterase/lipase